MRAQKQGRLALIGRRRPRWNLKEEVQSGARVLTSR
jgi:hypothetical protein